MKKVWFAVGAVIIVILLLLQTRFNVFLQVDSGGYAVKSGTAKSALLANADEELNAEGIELYKFNPLDYIYQRAGSYYLGEEKKTQIDLGFPLYVNGGAGLFFTDNSGTLFDVFYDEYSVYQNLTVNNAGTFNPDGMKAHPMDFIFYGTQSGFYYNLMGMNIERGDDSRDIFANSIMNLTEDTITYCEFNDGELVFGRIQNMSPGDPVTINGDTITYHELLVNLGVINDKSASIADAGDYEEPDVIIPEPEVQDEDILTEQDDKSDLDKDRNDEDRKNDPEKKIKEDQKNSPQKSTGSPAKAPSSGSSGGSSGGSRGNSSAGAANRGVRPDSARPDKKKETKPTVPDYVKPTVTVNSITNGTYRIILNVTVDDPSQRIDKVRRVQFDFYEVPSGTGKEKLAYHTYTGGKGDGGPVDVTAGAGNIKPSTTYRMVAYYTYKNEYDEDVYEVIELPKEYITTDPIDPDWKVEIKEGGEPGSNTAYKSIPVQYDMYLEILHFKNDSLNSDAEQVYGINHKEGIKITFTNKETGDKLTVPFETSFIKYFKENNDQTYRTKDILTPNSSYDYEITMVDYFDHDIKVINGTGSFDTCKSRPFANIELKSNTLESQKFGITIMDTQNSAIQKTGAGENEYDLYFVITTKDLDKIKNEDAAKAEGEPKEFDMFVDRMEAFASAADPLTARQEFDDGTVEVHYAYKVDKSDYWDSTNGKINLTNFDIPELKMLDLDTKYYAYIIGDYDINNKKGPVWYGTLASTSFTSASIASVGKIYVNVGMANLTAHDVILTYELNKSRTNDYLQQILSVVEFDLVQTDDKSKTDSSIAFDSNMLDRFKGYTGYDGDKYVYQDIVLPDGTTIALPDGTFQKETGVIEHKADSLNSKTSYTIKPVVKARYHGKDYKMDVVLSISPTFKTLKEPARVDVKDVTLAAGTLMFKVKIIDEDGAIVGYSSDTVIMQLYEIGGDGIDVYVKSIRYKVNEPDYYEAVIRGLKADTMYKLRFIAMEYNEGYSGANIPNKLLEPGEIKITDITNISGTIKINGLDAVGSNRIKANLNVNIKDTAGILRQTEDPDNRYYITLEKKGVKDPISNESFNDYVKEGVMIKKTHEYTLDKEKSEYTATLYIYYHNNKLILDTVTFNTKDVMYPISNAQEFVDLIKKNPSARFCLTADIDLGNTSGIPTDEEGKYNSSYKAVNIAGTFNGELDGQGYTVKYDYNTNTTPWFSNVGPKGEMYNMVLELKTDTNNALQYKGVLCSQNYGHLHDIYIDYRGGSTQNNYYFGLVSYINAATGVIERFVIKSNPETGYMPLTARAYCGYLTAQNMGTVRYGYVYGEDVYAALKYYSSNTNLYIGGVVGNNVATGNIYDVYSSVNVTIDSGKQHQYIGSVSGSGTGKIHNIYGVEEPLYNHETDTIRVIDSASDSYKFIGPVVGSNNNSNKDIYYYNSRNKRYTYSTRQNIASVENLNDYNWQSYVLGSEFNVQPVEVGFYPHVKWSTTEMPEQELVELPKRTESQVVDIINTEVISYDVVYDADGNPQQTAKVLFRLSNKRNVQINTIEMEGIEVELDPDSAATADGFTTITGTLSNPDHFVSRYEINKVICTNDNNRTETADYTKAGKIKPAVNVDFYRIITTTQEWKDYVIGAPSENARLGADLDFSTVTNPNDIMLKNIEYTGKLDGEDLVTGERHKLSNISLGKGISTSSTPDNVAVFFRVSGSIKNLDVENFRINDCDAASRSYKTYYGFIRSTTGEVENVHMKSPYITAVNYIGCLIGYADGGSTIKDCTVTDPVIDYVEKANTNTTGRVGGLVGYATSCTIQNCYVRNAEINVGDVQVASGVGGIVGETNCVQLENLYTTGEVIGRCMNVGGIVGNYFSDNVRTDITNVISNMSVTSYQDAVGGLVGQFNLNSNLLTTRTNLTGIAFGNVTCTNPTAELVSYTMGYIVGGIGKFSGCECQLINGLPDQNLDSEGIPTDNTYQLISYEDACNPAIYTDESILQMDEVYDYSPVADGNMPKLYYSDGSALLPFQEDDIKITNVGVNNKNEITVSKVIVDNSLSRNITIIVNKPERVEIASVSNLTEAMKNAGERAVTIEELNYYDVGEKVVSSTGTVTGESVVYDYGTTAQIQIHFQNELKQVRFYDSYNLTEIKYTYKDDTKAQKTIYRSSFAEEPVVIDLQMFGYIDSLARWNECFSADNEYGDYQNYKITKSFSFDQGIEFSKNAKIGRLIGDDGGSKVTLSNIFIGQSKTETNTNLIFRINNELSNINFESVKVTSSGRSCNGLIGTSAASIKNVNFTDIDILSKDSNNNNGIIGKQSGGKIENVKLEDIDVKSTHSSKNSLTGALMGETVFGTVFDNVEVKNCKVDGNQYVGGLVGRCNGSFNNVRIIDTTVTGKSTYIGGMVGQHTVNHQATNSKYLTNCSVEGTAITKDANGRLASSSMVVSSTYNSNGDVYVGGLAGYSSAYALGFPTGKSLGLTSDADAKKATVSNRVQGVIVRSSGSRVGGAFGQVHNVTNTEVSDCLVTMGDNIPTTIMNSRGGLVGYTVYYARRNDVDNVLVETDNCQNVGLLTGYLGNDAYYNYVNNSEMIAEGSNSSLTLSGFGGLVGKNNAAIYYSVVRNAIIDASKSNMNSTGGIVGINVNNSILGNLVYTETAVDSSGPTGNSKYYIKGNRYTGGIVGNQSKGSVYDNSCNANVISNTYAGGIAGRFNNGYTLNKGVPSYSEQYFRYNIFAGTVESEYYAGGLVGSMSLVEDNSKTEFGGRFAGVSGKYSETTYTYANMMLADYVKSKDANAYAFVGNHDGFEGMANYDGYNNVDSDKSANPNRMNQHARRTVFWEGTKLISSSHPSGIMLKDVKVGASGTGIIDKDNASLSVDAGAYNTYHATNFGEYRFPYYAGTKTGDTTHLYPSSGKGAYNNTDDGDKRLNFNVRLVTHESLDKYNIYWSAYINENGGSPTMNPAAYNHRFTILTKDVKNLDAPYKSVSRYGHDGVGNSYLPQLRNGTGSAASSINTYLAKLQVDNAMDMPIPAAIEWDRDYTNTTDVSEIKGARLYASGVDEITIEFGSDVRNATGATYTLKYGGTDVPSATDVAIASDVRTYTYSYDYGEGLTLTYTYGGITKTITKSVGELKNRIMVWDTKYYKIEDSGQLTSGTQTDKVTSTESDYITLMKGQALRGSGSTKKVYNVATGAEIKTITTGISGVVKHRRSNIVVKNNVDESADGDSNTDTTEDAVPEQPVMEHLNPADVSNNRATPFQKSIYNGIEVKTFRTFTDFGGVEKPGQFIVSALGNHAMIDDDLNNIKDSYVLFTKDGEEHCVILDEDGFILDLYQGDTPEAIGAPDDFKMSGIIRMTNNMDSTAPYILVEYANGSIVGYNFMTREYLFQDLKEEHISLLDYAKQYFEGDKSELTHAFESFSGNYDLAKKARNVTKLREIVASYDKTAEPKGDTHEASEETKIAKDGEEASEDTALKENETASDKEEKYKNGEEKSGITEQPESNGDSTLIGESTADGASEASGEYGSTGKGLAGGNGSYFAAGNNPASGDEAADGGDSLANTASDSEDEEGLEVFGPDPDKKATVTPTPGTDSEDELSSSDDDSKVHDPLDDIEEDEEDKKDADSEDKDAEPTPTPTPTPEAVDDASAGSGDGSDGDGSGSAEESKSKFKVIGKESGGVSGDGADGSSEEVTEVTTEQTLLAVYNAQTGMYELIDMDAFITNPTYQSENVELGVKNMSVYSDYHAEKTETKKEKGLALYLLATFAILAGIFGGIYFKKKNNMNV